MVFRLLHNLPLGYLHDFKYNAKTLLDIDYGLSDRSKGGEIDISYAGLSTY
jgi:hypothetical protein